jgi:hypothetical protein
MKKIFFFASLKSVKKGVIFGSISQRYGSANLDQDPDPDPHKNVTDPQHYLTFPFHGSRDMLNSVPPSVRIKFAQILKCLR